MTVKEPSNLAIYLPMDRRHALSQGIALPDRTTGAALFADLSGFTPLTNTLLQELGPQRGPEELTLHLNRIYSALIAEIHRYHGSVIGFSGDAITCWFDQQTTAVPLATACALQLQAAMDRLGDGLTPNGTVIPLAIKVVVVAGHGRRFLIGDPSVRKIEVIAGNILTRMASAEKLLQRGEVGVRSEILGHFGDRIDVQEWRQDKQGEYFAVINGLGIPVPADPWAPPDNFPIEVASPWLLNSFADRLAQGHFMAQMRTCVSFFLKFSGLQYDQDDQAGTKLDAFIRWVQQTLTYYGGHLIQLTLGDKGSYLHAVFGALVAHEDNAGRAVAAALDLQAGAAQFSFIEPLQIGLSQGRMYTGAYGSAERATFGVLGNEVNVAARLMGQAQPGQSLVTSHIAKAAVDYTFEPLGALSLKGLNEPLPVLIVQDRPQVTQKAVGRKEILPMIGRSAKLEILVDRLHELVEGQSSRIIIEGEAGIGKSRLVAAWLDQSIAQTVRSFLAAANAIEKTTPYYIWRPIFHQIFAFEQAGSTVEDRREHLKERLSTLLGPEDPDLALAPLLNLVLDFELPETEETQRLQGEGRAQKSNEFMSRILQLQAARDPLFIILEDVHWMDASSWELVRLVNLDVHPLLIALVTRPLPDPQPLAYRRLLQLPQHVHLRLDNLSPEETLQLVCNRLGVAELPTVVETLIRDRAEGHPFYSEELIYSLRDIGLITVENGECHLASDVDWQTVTMPSTVQGVIASRIDLLTLAEQLVLKVASVIGRVFAQQTLAAIHPIEADKAALGTYLEHLARLNLTPLESPSPELAYIFKHVITQEVVYRSLLFAQRHELHRAVAEWYEQRYAAELQSHYALLAYHWQQAEVIDKTVHYLNLAGQKAVQDGAFNEAISLFERLLALESQLASRPTQLQQAQWRYWLGLSYYYIRQLQRSLTYFGQALQLLGMSFSTDQRFLLLGWLWEWGRHFGRRLAPWPTFRRLEDPGALMAAQIYLRIGRIAWIEIDQSLSLYNNAKAMNLSQQIGPLAYKHLAQGYAIMAIGMEWFRLPQLGHWYAAQAMHLDGQVDDLEAKDETAAIMGTYHLSRAELSKAKVMFERAYHFRQQAGNRVRLLELQMFIIITLKLQGKLSNSQRLAAEGYQIALRYEDKLMQLAILWLQGMTLFDQGQQEAARPLLLRLEALAADIDYTHGHIISLAGRLAVQTYEGALVEGQQTAEALFSAMKKTTFTTIITLAPYITLVNFSLANWEAMLTKENGHFAKACCRSLLRFAKLERAGLPSAWIAKGRYLWLSGRRKKALQWLEKGIAAAQQFGMPFEEAEGHYHLGRFLGAADANGRRHLDEAAAIFERIGVKWDAKRASDIGE